MWDKRLMWDKLKEDLFICLFIYLGCLKQFIHVYFLHKVFSATQFNTSFFYEFDWSIITEGINLT